MLSSKRCGSTAMFHVFQKHPDVGVCHIDHRIVRWEPNFWNLAADAIDGDSKPFISRFRDSHPFLEMPDTFTESTVFELWNQILREQGPTVFDKSPQYLGHEAGMNLLLRYRDAGNDVRIFSVIRDPRDSITSQHELWKSFERVSPKDREKEWLDKYHHLERLQNNNLIPLFRYEDVTAAPSCYLPMLFRHCDCQDVPESYDHLRPMTNGRYSASLSPSIRFWRFSDAFSSHLRKYGYPKRQVGISKRCYLVATMLLPTLQREVRSIANYLNLLPVLKKIWKLTKRSTNEPH